MGIVRRRARRRTALVVGGAAYAAGRAGRKSQPDDGGQEGYEELGPGGASTRRASGRSDTDELERPGNCMPTAP